MVPPELNRATLDFILDYTKGAPGRQIATSHSHDGKAFQLFAASSVVLALASAGGVHHGAALGFYSAALATYLVGGRYAFQVIRTRNFRVVDDADGIWSLYWNIELETVKHGLVDDIASAYTENAELLRTKARALRCLVVASGIETALVAAAVISSLA